MKRVKWIDILKGIGAIAVVVGHFYNNADLLRFLSSFHLPLFFFAGGYLYKPEIIGTWIRRKLSNIMKPYIFFVLISIVAWYILSLSQGKTFEIGILLRGYLWGDYSSIIYNRVLWFIPAYFCIITVYNIMVNVFGFRITWFLSFLIAILWIFNFEWPVNLPWGIDESMVHYFPFVALGNISRQTGVFEKIRDGRVSRNCILIGLLIMFDIYVLFRMSNTNLNGYIGAFIGICICASISIYLEDKSKVLEKVGQASIIILGLQVPVYDAISKWYCTMLKISHEECMEMEVHAFVCCIVTIAVCYGIFILINRKALWILKVK